MNAKEQIMLLFPLEIEEARLALLDTEEYYDRVHAELQILVTPYIEASRGQITEALDELLLGPTLIELI